MLSKLKWSDVWILQAIRISVKDEKLDLAGLIAVADAINHAVPTSEEFNNAIYRLQQHGLVTTAANQISLTPKANELFTRTSGLSITGQRDFIEKALLGEKWSEKYDPNDLEAPLEFGTTVRFNNAVLQ